jgi:hypothetical protein
MTHPYAPLPEILPPRCVRLVLRRALVRSLRVRLISYIGLKKILIHKSKDEDVHLLDLGLVAGARASASASTRRMPHCSAQLPAFGTWGHCAVQQLFCRVFELYAGLVWAYWSYPDPYKMRGELRRMAGGRLLHVPQGGLCALYLCGFQCRSNNRSAPALSYLGARFHGSSVGVQSRGSQLRKRVSQSRNGPRWCGHQLLLSQ